MICLNIYIYIYIYIYAKKNKKQKDQNVFNIYIYAKKNKKQKDQNAFNMIASVYTRRCGSYRMYLECDSPHQIVMIVYELK